MLARFPDRLGQMPIVRHTNQHCISVAGKTLLELPRTPVEAFSLGANGVGKQAPHSILSSAARQEAKFGRKVTAPMNDREDLLPDEIEFGPARGWKLLKCGFGTTCGLMCGAISFLLRDSGGSFTAACLWFVAAGSLLVWNVVTCVGVFRGLPCLRVTGAGVGFLTAFGTWTAEWPSLGAFDVSYQMKILGTTMGVVRVGKAAIVGPHVSKNLANDKDFVIPDELSQPIATVVRKINERRPSMVQVYMASTAETTSPLFEEDRLTRRGDVQTFRTIALSVCIVLIVASIIVAMAFR